MRDKKQIIVNIKKEIVKVNPYIRRDLARAISYIFDCFRTLKEETISDMEYYDIVGEIFKFNPKFYMDSIYPKMKSLEMTRYIIEKYCLYEGEKIIYEFIGKITYSIFYDERTLVKEFITGGGYSKNLLNAIVKGGTIYVTNYRIIAQGKLSVQGGTMKLNKKGKKRVSNDSLSQKLPCYGYQFRIRNNVGLKIKSNFVKYQVSDERFTEDTLRTKTNYEIREALHNIKIKLPKIQVTELYEILSNDIDHTFEM